MQPIDWLLLFLAERSAAIDPVRVQKGMFLLSEEGPLPPAERYAFVPYAYGPMSRDVYRDTRRLVARELAETSEVPGHRWTLVAAGRSGLEQAELLRARARRDQPAALEQLRHVRALVDRLTFSALLEHVYDRHPAYATRSVFRRP